MNSTNGCEMATTKVRLTNSEEFNNSLIKILQHSRKPVAETMEKQTRLIVGKVLAVTPPTRRGVTGPKAKKKGEKTVAGNIGKVLYGVPVAANRSLSQVTERAIAKQHSKHRVRGRVNRSLGARKKMAAPTRKLKQYIKKRQQAVGMLAAGWNKAAQRFGLKRGHYAWMKRHNPPSYAKMKVSDKRIHIKFINKVKFAGDVGIMSRALDYAMHWQARDNEKIIHHFKRSARKQGFKVK